MKDVQATEEAFSPQKRTSNTSKHGISEFFLFLWVIFALLDPESQSGSETLGNPRYLKLHTHILFLKH
jgi:hypothetical protein